MDPVPGDVEGYEKFMERYTKGLAIERAAVGESLIRRGERGPPEAGIAFGPAFAWRTTQRY